ncbi:MAG: FkbM family methyltransferase [Promethearchaeota archaeon]
MKKKLENRYNTKNIYIVIKHSLKERIEELKNFYYYFSKDFVSYIENKKINVSNYIKNLPGDDLSKKVVKKFIFDAYQMSNYLKWMIRIIFTYINIFNFFNKLHFKNNFSKILKQKYFMPINRYEISVFYYNSGLKFLPAKVFSYLKGKDFIDGGAWIGDSALIFEKKYFPKKVYAFEPENENYRLMMETISKNNLSRVIPINKGLGKKKALTAIKKKGDTSYISKLGEQKVELTSIDEFVKENNLSIGLIKLDIEGFELEAIKGAEKTIKKLKPVLLIAIYHNGAQFFETLNLLKIFVPEYHFIIRKIYPFDLFAETFLLAWPKVVEN